VILLAILFTVLFVYLLARVVIFLAKFRD